VFEILSILPFPFWVVTGVLIVGCYQAAQRAPDGSGLPMFAALGTVGVWYLGDVFYNDYAGYHTKIFDSETLDHAWWEVAWFLVMFLALTPPVHRWVNARYLGQSSKAFLMFKCGVNQPAFQRQLRQLLKGAFAVWAFIAVVAAVRLREEIVYYFFPFLGYNVYPWGRARIGGGFSAVLTLIFYVQELTAATFGVVAAAATNRPTRILAVILCVLAWPAFLVDRTRSNMLVVIMPGILTWGFLVLRGGMLKKITALGICFVVLNAWMGFIIENRSTSSISSALVQKGFQFGTSEKVHHQGLNMFEELCWVNSLISKRVYRPNWGARYFAEAVNFVPRVIWRGKPEIGIDYAIARGQGLNGGEAGVGATVSTGLIGQGVVNFGRVLGPAFAAFLISIWVAVLARIDLDPRGTAGVPLLGLGLILTFNLGRDISLIVLYPFVFSVLLLWLFNYYRAKPAVKVTPPRVGENRKIGLRQGSRAPLRQLDLNARGPAKRRSKIESTFR
jgi:hypothetical protein